MADLPLAWSLFRFRVARTLIHAGLRAMPEGRARRELTDLLWEWGRYVADTVARHKETHDA